MLLWKYGDFSNANYDTTARFRQSETYDLEIEKRGHVININFFIMGLNTYLYSVCFGTNAKNQQSSYNTNKMRHYQTLVTFNDAVAN